MNSPDRPDRIEQVGFVCLLAVVATVQFSIAVAETFFGLAIASWLILVLVRRESVGLPAFGWALMAYAAWTFVSIVFSGDRFASLSDQRELLLLLVVPLVFRLTSGSRALTVLDVIVTAGAISAVVGIVQYGVLNYDHLGRRPQGTLGHYMTYSGTLMLVIGAAAARLLFRMDQRAWSALLMPALVVALTLTFTRSAWVGACVAVGLLFVLKDFRLLGVLPVLAALFIALAPQALTARVYSMFNLNDPTNRDRVAMMHAGAGMIRDHPLVGVGPDMVIRRYPDYRDAAAVEPINPHLHNVPMQIAAERGVPALVAWATFVVILARDLWRRFRAGSRTLAGAGLASLAAMLSAGFFEYNFGDSEFLILFLVLVTLPFAAGSKRQAAASA